MMTMPNTWSGNISFGTEGGTTERDELHADGGLYSEGHGCEDGDDGEDLDSVVELNWYRQDFAQESNDDCSQGE